MEDDTKDDVFEITAKNYQKLSKNIEKEGYREGKSDGSDKMFQKSFDAGYEDGFRVGFYLGNGKDSDARTGRCDMCKDKELMNKNEKEVREIVGRNFEELVGKVLN